MSKQDKPLVGVVMGSSSDWDVMQHAVAMLKDFGVPFEAQVVSAHRMADDMFRYAESADKQRFGRFPLTLRLIQRSQVGQTGCQNRVFATLPRNQRERFVQVVFCIFPLARDGVQDAEKVTHLCDVRMLTAALDGLVARHKAIAANLANQSTPGYKRFDVLFEEQLDGVRRGRDLLPRVVVDRSAGDADGNNVVPEDELGALTRVEMTFETVARALAMKAAWMRAAVSSR